jgi:hypothetical protein
LTCIFLVSRVADLVSRVAEQRVADTQLAAQKARILAAAAELELERARQATAVANREVERAHQANLATQLEVERARQATAEALRESGIYLIRGLEIFVPAKHFCMIYPFQDQRPTAVPRTCTFADSSTTGSRGGGGAATTSQFGAHGGCSESDGPGFGNRTSFGVDIDLLVTLWNDPTICRRVSSPSSAGFPGFAFAVRGKFPELGGSSMSFFLLPFGKMWNEDRIRVATDAGLADAVRVTQKSFASAPLSRNHPTFFVFDDGLSPTTSPGHPKAIPAAPSPPAGSVSSGSSQRSRQKQSAMRACVLRRDGGCCIFCGHSVALHLECAHIIDHSLRGDVALLAASNLFDTFDAINGITLCIECHAAFGRGLICVDAHTMKLKLADGSALAEEGNYSGAWRHLSGSLIRHCDPRFRAYWPTFELFAFQQERFEKIARERRSRQLVLGTRVRTQSLSHRSVVPAKPSAVQVASCLPASVRRIHDLRSNAPIDVLSQQRPLAQNAGRAVLVGNGSTLRKSFASSRGRDGATRATHPPNPSFAATATATATPPTAHRHHTISSTPDSVVRYLSNATNQALVQGVRYVTRSAHASEVGHRLGKCIFIFNLSNYSSALRFNLLPGENARNRDD